MFSYLVNSFVDLLGVNFKRKHFFCFEFKSHIFDLLQPSTFYVCFPVSQNLKLICSCFINILVLNFISQLLVLQNNFFQ